VQIEALVAALDERQIKALLAEHSIRRRAYERLLAAAEKALPELLRKLQGPD
jgi:hypothetical protein